MTPRSSIPASISVAPCFVLGHESTALLQPELSIVSNLLMVLKRLNKFLVRLQIRRNHQPQQVAKQPLEVLPTRLLSMLTSTNLRRRCQLSNLSLLVYDLGEEEEEGD